MRIEIIPTRENRIILIATKFYPESKVDPKEWNKAIDDGIEFLDDSKMEIKLI